MATQVIQNLKPAFQVRKFGDPDTQIDMELFHQFVPYVGFWVGYARNFAGAIDIIISKKLFGGMEVVVHTEAAFAGSSFFRKIDVELQHGESVRVRTTGAVLIAGNSHEAQIGWDEINRIEM